MTRSAVGELVGEGKAPLMPQVSLTAVERALLRLLAALQARCGAPSFTRLLVRAVLNVWV